MKPMPLLVLAAAALACQVPEGAPASGSKSGGGAAASAAAPAKSIPKVVGAAERRSGLFDLWVAADQGKVWLELPQGEGRHLAECLLISGLRQGLGSNPVGLDRGQLGSARLVRFERMGQRVFLVQPNLSYRATDAGADEVRATAESFASSVLWSAPVAAEEGDRLLLELTPFLLQDRHGVAATLASSNQGKGWKVDGARSGLVPEEVLAFPDNLEFEALVTLSGGQPAGEVRSVTPEPKSISLVQHHSLVRLPDGDYQPRRHDPRMGANSVGWSDYATELQAPVGERRVARHRLSAGDELVYYVDRGAPEPIRSALVEGASWWEEAFREAGFPGAFRVELLPVGAHPLDVRYNVIQWVHRSTRGWSYGNSIVDPRSGEILKGHVSLGSLRVRQDRMLFEGLLGALGSGQGGDRDPVELALARIRQLSAHEVGHTLGLSHNFAASTYAGGASVMDYPAPLVRLDDRGAMDLSRVYGIGLGVWDKHAIRMLYAEAAAGQSEAELLQPMLARVGRHDLRFSTDSDARPAGGAHPRAALWDTGSDAPLVLEQTMALRAKALANFGVDRLPEGWPLGSLQEVFVPIYLYHRYQVEAAAKWVAGIDYDPAARDSAQMVQEPVSPPDQMRAVLALLATLDPAALDIPDGVLDLLLPGAPSGLGNGERFRGRTGRTFDALEAAGTASDLTLGFLLHPERAARLVDQHRRDEDYPGLFGLLRATSQALFPDEDPQEGARLAGIREVVQSRYAQRLMDLASDPGVVARVGERVEAELQRLSEQLLVVGGRVALAKRLQRFLQRQDMSGTQSAPAPDAPPGSPIGMAWQGPLQQPNLASWTACGACGLE